MFESLEAASILGARRRFGPKRRTERYAGKGERVSLVLIIAAVSLGTLAFLYAWRRRPRPTPPRASPPRAPRSAPQKSPKHDPATAAQARHTLRTLRQAQAQWPQILETLNPRNDPAIGSLLVDLRGPHLFNPVVALAVIEDGIEDALRAHPSASLVDALRMAKAGMERVTRYGD